ncbi:hypothetical protein BGZ61DRAFT_46715 [Ilyonectria robusta]|uniref:uncharacterized protein n=1 Tax=Ilyonectria robusta TaxID=1079257 RepID=UPI001E8DD62A|nr:uncharacterized protein BGZ61DRAFT_46715 [Ilyonectria robusta]KAH8686842.1 hypothetical protein BGZ61DRAFT_46715 [Ilyonectria robusta]
MPVRARSKVVKLAVASNASSASNAGRRSVSRNSSFSSVAQEQLEQLAQDAASNVAVDAQDLKVSIARDEEDDNSAMGVGLNSEAMLSNNSGMLHNALDATPEATPFPTPINQTANPPTRTAGDVALGIYGDSIKIDSALCKKLACEEALRDPGQRRTGQKLNMERRSNVEAMLAHVTGEQVARPCKNCHKGHGPWNQCVVYDGQMCGSCTNCWFNASGARCTFHENNHPQAQTIFGSAVSVAHQPTLLYQQTPVPLPPMPQAAPGISQTVPTMPQLSPATVTMAAFPDMAHWGLTDPTRRLVTQAMGDVVGFSRRERHLARIEAAAKELGMRVAEYDEYLRTPEGMAEHQRAQEQAQAHLSDAGLDDTHSHASPLP